MHFSLQGIKASTRISIPRVALLNGTIVKIIHGSHMKATSINAITMALHAISAFKNNTIMVIFIPVLTKKFSQDIQRNLLYQ